MEQTKQCPSCEGTMKYKEGLSIKTGKPWKAYFCETDKKHVEWIRENSVPAGMKPYQPKQLKSDVDWDKIRERKEDGMEWLNSKNGAAQIVSALIQKGEISYSDWYETYKNIAETIYGFRETEK